MRDAKLVTLGSLGRQRFVRRAGPFFVSETTHDRGQVTAPHVHERASLNISLAGAYAEFWRGASRSCVPGWLVAKPEWEIHANDFRNIGARCVLIEVDAPDRELVRASSDLFDTPAVRDARPVRQHVQQIRRGLADESASTALELEAAVYELVTRLSHSARLSAEMRPGTWLSEVREMLHGLPPDQITLRGIAAAVGRHPAHVGRAFRAQQGCTMGQFVRRLQVSRAAALLRSSARSISAVALEVGFYDHSHFTREFQRYAGVSPRVYRDGHR